MSRSISLPMYDFAELQSSTTAVLDAIAAEVRQFGDDGQVDSPDSSNYSTLISLWRGTEMYLSQTCGLPYIEELQEFVDVLGTFLWDGISDDLGRYRTDIVVRDDFVATQVSELGGAQPVVTNTQSLSGWCSLGCALAEVTDDPKFVQPYLLSDRHVSSLQMLQDRVADVASIDPVTFKILGRIRPALVKNLRIIGSGPLVFATPVIVSKVRIAQLGDLRAALHRVVDNPTLTGEMAAIGIVGFVDHDGANCAMIHDLVVRAEQVLPRRG